MLVCGNVFVHNMWLVRAGFWRLLFSISFSMSFSISLSVLSAFYEKVKSVDFVFLEATGSSHATHCA